MSRCERLGMSAEFEEFAPAARRVTQTPFVLSEVEARDPSGSLPGMSFDRLRTNGGSVGTDRPCTPGHHAARPGSTAPCPSPPPAGRSSARAMDEKGRPSQWDDCPFSYGSPAASATSSGGSATRPRRSESHESHSFMDARPTRRPPPILLRKLGARAVQAASLTFSTATAKRLEIGWTASLVSLTIISVFFDDCAIAASKAERT